VKKHVGSTQSLWFQKFPVLHPGLLLTQGTGFSTLHGASIKILVQYNFLHLPAIHTHSYIQFCSKYNVEKDAPLDVRGRLTKTFEKNRNKYVEAEIEVVDPETDITICFLRHTTIYHIRSAL
jgi:hypothetical protein